MYSNYLYYCFIYTHLKWHETYIHQPCYNNIRKIYTRRLIQHMSTIISKCFILNVIKHSKLLLTHIIRKLHFSFNDETIYLHLQTVTVYDVCMEVRRWRTVLSVSANVYLHIQAFFVNTVTMHVPSWCNMHTDGLLCCSNVFVNLFWPTVNVTLCEHLNERLI